jgi:5,10-methylene-tetrahydrofolate dehydrogenase/methenyl tetrahydrofolate cyclohydrolase
MIQQLLQFIISLLLSTSCVSLLKKVSYSSIRYTPTHQRFNHRNLNNLRSMATVIDGNEIAAQIRSELKITVDEMQANLGVVPGLAVILVGARRDSATYVRMKKKACTEIGIASFPTDFPAETTQAELIAKIDELNANPLVHGILVQLPLPGHFDEQFILERITPSKDVDGLHPLNVAHLANTKTHAPGKSAWSFDSIGFHVSCTPQGCIELLDRSGVKIEGKNAVVLGRSNIVGIPVALLLMQRNATVTIAHSRTADIEATVRGADIVVAAVGRAEMVKKEWIKPGAVVIDVGINSVDDASKKAGYRLVGDVDYEGCKEVASQITPVRRLNSTHLV